MFHTLKKGETINSKNKELFIDFGIVFGQTALDQYFQKMGNLLWVLNTFICNSRKGHQHQHIIITNSDIYINISAGQHICCEHTGQLYKKRINININFIITINTKAKNHYKHGKK